MMNVDMGLYIKFEVDEGDEDGLGQGRHGHKHIFLHLFFRKISY